MNDNLHIDIDEPAWRRIRGVRQIVARAVAACRPWMNATSSDAEISVLLCSDARIRDLNKVWRGKDKPTNVLSFPAGMPSHLGDIAIAYETVFREASEEGKSIAAHLSHMTVHGSLHLAGFDHEVEAEAEEMESLEQRILASLGYNDPYGSAAPKPKAKTRRYVS